ncbi:MAG: SRPBCC domain-containing protein [Gemmatimonadaceae bacterium]
MNALPFQLDRTVVIEAARETVFRFFTDDTRWAKWWGAGSTIDPQVGGKVYIRHPGNVEVMGEVVEISPPNRLVFTYGYGSGTPFGPGGSRVTIQLEPEGAGTRLHLVHDFPEEEARNHHVQGWRYQLSLFGNVVADEQHANAASIADTWFNAWADPDVDVRQKLMSEIASEDVHFRDRYSLNDGIDDLLAHITATQRFMPGIRMERRGNIRHCQGTMLADWAAISTDGKTLMQGVNVFVLRADGKISKVTGLVTPQ